MKLLFVSNGFPPRGKWGTEFYTHQLACALQARGHALSVLHPERDGSRARFELERHAQQGIEVLRLHNPGDPRKRFLDSYSNPEVERIFERLLVELQPDLVHFTYLLWGLSVRLPEIARERGVASVLTLTDYGLVCHRGQMFDHRLERCFGPKPPEVCARCVREPSRHDAAPLALWARRAAVRALALAGGLGRVPVTRDLAQREQAVRRALEACGLLLAPTAVMAQTFAQLGLVGPRIEQLCYAFDGTPYAQARSAPPGPPVFGYLGQFTPHKGLHTLLEAARIMERRLPESVEPWSVRLYGAPSGGRHRRYAPQLFAAGLSRRVEVCAPFEPEEAPRVLGELSAVVLPSLWDENAPLTVLQARAAGVPVLASSVPGVRDVLQHGEHGRLFAPGDAVGLADAMRELLLSRRTRTGVSAPPEELESHVARIEGLYAEVLEALPRSAAGALASRGLATPASAKERSA